MGKVIRWAGFLNGKIDLTPTWGYGQLYARRKDATALYQDVRKVEVREVKPRRKGTP